MHRIACFFSLFCLIAAFTAFADGLSIEELPDRVIVADRGQPIFEFIHSPLAAASETSAGRTHFFHPVYGMLGEVISGESASVWGTTPGFHWGWSRLGVNNVLINIEEGSGGRRVFERWLGSEIHEGEGGGGEGVFGIQSAWITDQNNQATVLENMTVVVYPATSSSREFDVSVLLRNISDKSIMLEGGLPGTGLSIALNPERTDWAVSSSMGWAKPGTPFMSPWAQCTYRDDRRSTRSGLAVLQDSRNPAFSTSNWLLEEGPRITVGTPSTYKIELKSAEFLEFRYRIILYRAFGSGPNMTAEFTRFMGVEPATR